MQSILDILDAIERGMLTPLAAITRSLNAIDELDSGIDAFAFMPERQAVLDEASRSNGPLAGIAIGIKDIFDTADMPTAYGSTIHARYRPAADAALVALFRQRGATIVGKTATTEFAFLNPTTTRNPHNPSHTPGGSSSGSAAAVAAGMIPAAIGTQTGGSIIRPAAYCGIAGYKPSFRLVPTVGAKTFSWSLDTIGFFAARVPDVARLAALTTRRPLDVQPIDPTKLRLGIYRSADWESASHDMRAAVEQAAALAEAAGARIVQIEERQPLAAARTAHGTLQDFEAGQALGHEFQRHGDRLSSVLRETLARGRAIAPEDYDAARRIARQARRDAGDLFATVDAVLTPAATGAAPDGLQSTGSPIFNKLWTLTGSPATTISGMRDSSGMPLGIQLVARFGRDQTALSVAGWLEDLLAGDGK